MDREPVHKDVSQRGPSAETTPGGRVIDPANRFDAIADLLP